MGCETAFGRSPLFSDLCCFSGAALKVWVYIDGFNLYKGRLQGTPYKWLDLLKLSQALLPNDQVDYVKYFSAKVDARAGDPDQPLRQIAYWQALRTLPQIEIIEGHFLRVCIKSP